MQYWRLYLVVVVAAIGVAASSEPNDRVTLAVEAVLRLESTNLAENAALHTAVTNLLSRTRGTANYIKLVQKFHLTNVARGLIEVASGNAGAEVAAQAMQLVIERGDLAEVKRALATTNTETAGKLIGALGNSGKKEAVGLLVPLASDPDAAPLSRRNAVRALAKTAEGAGEILRLAKESKLPDDVHFIASTELSRAPWPNIKAEAAKILPLPQTQNDEPLPAISELVQRKGNPQNGANVFRSPATVCINCHRVKGEGVEVGPDLSEIGTKLGKDALYESILDPNAGISFGYEAWQLAVQSGEEPFGIIVSETADEVAMKNATGVVTRYKKSEITRREKMKFSIMPSGIQQSMTVQELVDLVEYLASLKKS